MRRIQRRVRRESTHSGVLSELETKAEELGAVLYTMGCDIGALGDSQGGVHDALRASRDIVRRTLNHQLFVGTTPHSAFPPKSTAWVLPG